MVDQNKHCRNTSLKLFRVVRPIYGDNFQHGNPIMGQEEKLKKWVILPYRSASVGCSHLFATRKKNEEDMPKLRTVE